MVQLKTRVRVLATTSFDHFKPKSTSTPAPSTSSAQQKPKFGKSFAAKEEQSNSCPVCLEQHLIYKCTTFIAMSIPDRRAKVNTLKLCFNFLKQGHIRKDCKSRNCRTCNKQHHTMLHLEDGSQSESSKSTQSAPASQSSSQLSATAVTSEYSTVVILVTAVVQIRSASGELVPCTALLDGGSTVSFITKDLAHRLGNRLNDINICIDGINGSYTYKKQIETDVVSRINDYCTTAELIVSNHFAPHLPMAHFKVDSTMLPQRSQLADPQFNVPKRIDVLLGAPIFYDILIGNQSRLNENLVMHSTQFGYIITGKASQSHSAVTLMAVDGLREQIEKKKKSAFLGD